jgi:type III secretion protein O
MDILKKLLRIKKYREEKAELELIKARHALYQAEMSLERAKKLAHDHQNKCNQKEKELFDDLYKKIIFLKDLDAVVFKIELMKEEKKKLEENIYEADEKRTTAQDSVSVAKEIYREAIRIREKYSSILNEMNKEEIIENQLTEDREMEESSGSRYMRGRIESTGVAG